MSNSIESFISLIPDFESLSQRECVDFFVYFLTVVQGKSGVLPAEVDACFEAVSLPSYSGTRQYLHQKSQTGKVKKPSFVRGREGYRLERSRNAEIESVLQVPSHKHKTSSILRELLERLDTESEREFLREAIDCYEIGAYRAAIVLGWALTIDHLYEYIVAHHLPTFNAELSKVSDKRVRVTCVAKKDDFSDIPEDVFIRLCRSSNVVSNDVRKILDEKLGTRNSSAHPSNIRISEIKATDFLQDLTENIILKYEV